MPLPEWQSQDLNPNVPVKHTAHPVLQRSSKRSALSHCVATDTPAGSPRGQDVSGPSQQKERKFEHCPFFSAHVTLLLNSPRCFLFLLLTSDSFPVTNLRDFAHTWTKIFMFMKITLSCARLQYWELNGQGSKCALPTVLQSASSLPGRSWDAPFLQSPACPLKTNSNIISSLTHPTSP
jgi:hypothetical protein